MMKSISISIPIAVLWVVLLSGCQSEKVKSTSENTDNSDSIGVDTLEYADDEFPEITLENADSVIMTILKRFQTECTPTTLTCTESEICGVRAAVDSLTMVRYYKACEGEENKSAINEEYKCWQELEAVLENFHLAILLKYNEDDPWRFLNARQADKQLFQAHTKLLASDMEHVETCENRVDYKPAKADIPGSVKKFKDALAKYKSDAPTEYKVLIPLIEKWLKARAAETLPLPYYNKDKNTETFIKDIINYINTIEDFV